MLYSNTYNYYTLKVKQSSTDIGSSQRTACCSKPICRDITLGGAYSNHSFGVLQGHAFGMLTCCIFITSCSSSSIRGGVMSFMPKVALFGGCEQVVVPGLAYTI